jgi:hypothetical protein
MKKIMKYFSVQIHPQAVLINKVVQIKKKDFVRLNL